MSCRPKKLNHGWESEQTRFPIDDVAGIKVLSFAQHLRKTHNGPVEPGGLGHIVANQSKHPRSPTEAPESLAPSFSEVSLRARFPSLEKGWRRSVIMIYSNAALKEDARHAPQHLSTSQKPNCGLVSRQRRDGCSCRSLLKGSGRSLPRRSVHAASKGRCVG